MSSGNIILATKMYCDKLAKVSEILRFEEMKNNKCVKYLAKVSHAIDKRAIKLGELWRGKLGK
ncbi:MAG: hypothetical protein GX957_04020 [Clostridiaceae bacterium]|nr:hypothetical protein [Clostridiaceae bacterium]